VKNICKNVMIFDEYLSSYGEDVPKSETRHFIPDDTLKTPIS